MIRNFTITLILCLFITLTACTPQYNFSAAQFPTVDTHVHLWDIARPQGVPWPPSTLTVLYKQFLPEHYATVAAENNTNAVVIVQAGAWTDDNQWNLDATENQPDLYQGIVGNLSLEIGKPSFVSHFKQLIKNPRYKGFRLSSRPDPENFKNPLFWEHLNLIAEHNKTIDILIGRGRNSYNLNDAINIAIRNPDLKIIIDHVLAIPITGQPVLQNNLDLAKQIASFPNVYCKVSGLFGKSKTKPAPKTPDFYQHNLNLVWNLFGEDRLVYGSDWPVVLIEGSYAEHKNIIFQHFKSKGRSACEKIFYKNAIRFYDIKGF